MILVTTSARGQDTNLPLTPLFPPLLHRMVKYSIRAPGKELEIGEPLMEQDKPPAGFFLILSGQMRVMMTVQPGAEPIEVTRFGPGEMLGLASLLLGTESGAAVEATERSTVVSFDPRFFEIMVERVPSFGLAVARTLAERMAMLTDRVPVPEADPATESSGTAKQYRSSW